MKLEFSRQIFEKYLNIIFHENPSSGSRVVSCGQMARQTDGQTRRRTKNLIFSFETIRRSEAEDKTTYLSLFTLSHLPACPTRISKESFILHLYVED
jgi:hypothetical protein